MRNINAATVKHGWFAGRAETVLMLVLPAMAGVVVGLVVANFPLRVSAVIFSGLLALIMSIVRPDWALYLYFSGVVLMSDGGVPSSNVDSFYFPDVDIIEGIPRALTTFLLLMVGITLTRFLIVERRRPPVPLRSVIVITFIICVGLVTGLYRGGDARLYQIDFFGMFLPVLTFCLCVTLLDSRRRVTVMMNVLIAAASFKAIVQAGYFLAGLGWTYQLDNEAAYRIVTMDSADLLLYITLPLVVAHRVVRGDLRGGKALLYGGACAPMFYAVIFSYRRAQWVGLFFSLCLLWLGASKAVRYKVGLLLVGVFVLGGAMAVSSGLDAGKVTRITSRISSIFDSKHSSNVYHMVETERVLQDLAGSPLLGLGLGSHHTPVRPNQAETVPTNVVHNAFLYVWMKIGLPGLIFFLWSAWCFFRWVQIFRRGYIESPEWGTVLPLAASSGLWLAMFLSGPIPWYLHQTGLIALFAGMAVALMRQVIQEQNSEGGCE